MIAIRARKQKNIPKKDAISKGDLVLKEGDIVSVTVENTNVTIGQQLRNFMYKVTGNNSSAVTASASGIVTTNGQ